MSTREVELLVCDKCETTEVVECSHDIEIEVRFNGWAEIKPDKDHKPLFEGKFHLCNACRQPDPVGVVSEGEPWVR